MDNENWADRLSSNIRKLIQRLLLPPHIKKKRVPGHIAWYPLPAKGIVKSYRINNTVPVFITSHNHPERQVDPGTHRHFRFRNPVLPALLQISFHDQ